MLKFKASIRVGTKGDIWDFEFKHVVDGVNVSQYADVLGFSHTATVCGYTEVYQKDTNVRTVSQFKIVIAINRFSVLS